MGDLALKLVLSIAVLLSGPQQNADSLTTATKRFYRSDGATLVDGFTEIPFSLLSVGTGATAAEYRFEISVLDEDGTVLTASDWTGEVPSRFLNMAGASTVEHFTFAVPSGSYAVEIRLRDSSSGRVYQSASQIEGFDGAPFASDLIVSNAMRRSLGEGDEPAAGEVQKGVLFISGTPRPTLTTEEAALYYYVEMYPGAAASIQKVERVIDQSGGEIVATPTETISVGEAGGVAARQINLAGLPPGQYDLEVELQYPGTTVVRRASFLMTEPRDRAVASLPDEDVFAHYTEGQLDSLYAPLVFLIERQERGLYEGLSVEAKRNYLSQFWERRDPTPATPANEEMARFYDAIAIANNRYREGGAADVPGWSTDRGRIFLKYGDPDEFLSRPSFGRTQPYEIWKYSSRRPLKFVFYDETGFGHFVLIFTNDRTETIRPDWQELMGFEAVETVQRF